MGQTKMNQKGIEETIRRVVSFVQRVEYYEGSNLVYVRKAGELSSNEIERLERIGLKIRNIRPIEFETQYFKETTGLELSLEIV